MERRHYEERMRVEDQARGRRCQSLIAHDASHTTKECMEAMRYGFVDFNMELHAAPIAN
jgi:hypothetical protein